jgi:hypothetical protein
MTATLTFVVCPGPDSAAHTPASVSPSTFSARTLSHSLIFVVRPAATPRDRLRLPPWGCCSRSSSGGPYSSSTSTDAIAAAVSSSNS